VPLVGTEQVADRRLYCRHGLVIALAIIGLTASLGSRVPHVNFDLKPALHSHSSHNKVQHRDKDAFEWASPVASICLWITEYSALPEPTEKIRFRLQYDKLYNRPPPAV
jgi:hypothetical protein